MTTDNTPMLTQDEMLALNIRLSRNCEIALEKHRGAAMGIKRHNTGRPPEELDNPLRKQLERIWQDAQMQLSDFKRNGIDTGMSASVSFLPQDIDDVIVGISRVDYSPHRKQADKPLSVSKIMRILTALDVITVRDISNLLGVNKENAHKYFRAIRLGYHLIKI